MKDPEGKLVPLVLLEQKERLDLQDFLGTQVALVTKEIRVIKEVMVFLVQKAKEEEMAPLVKEDKQDQEDLEAREEEEEVKDSPVVKETQDNLDLPVLLDHQVKTDPKAQEDLLEMRVSLAFQERMASEVNRVKEGLLVKMDHQVPLDNPVLLVLQDRRERVDLLVKQDHRDEQVCLVKLDAQENLEKKDLLDLWVLRVSLGYLEHQVYQVFLENVDYLAYLECLA